MANNDFTLDFTLNFLFDEILHNFFEQFIGKIVRAVLFVLFRLIWNRDGPLWQSGVSVRRELRMEFFSMTYESLNERNLNSYLNYYFCKNLLFFIS